MARIARETIEQEKPAIDAEAVNAELALVANAAIEAKESTLALAKELGFQGSLVPDALEEAIRESNSRVGAELFAIGARLLLLKEQCAHGEFTERCQRLGYERRMAAKLMQAAAKFSNGPLTAHLERLGKTKLIELVALDDVEAEAFAEGKSVRGITYDDADRMSVSELRTALRKAKREAEEEKAAQAEIKRRRDERISQLEEENARLQAKPKPEKTPAMVEAEALSFLNDQVLHVVNEISVGLRSKFAKIDKLFGDEPLPNHVLLAQQQALAQVIQAARVLAGDYGVTLTLADQEPQETLWYEQAQQIFGNADTVAADLDLADSGE